MQNDTQQLPYVTLQPKCFSGAFFSRMIKDINTWQLTGCGDAHLLHNSDIFRKKQKKHLILVIKQLLNILKNIKAKEIDYFETLIFLNIEENTPFRSQDESS